MLYSQNAEFAQISEMSQPWAETKNGKSQSKRWNLQRNMNDRKQEAMMEIFLQLLPYWEL